MTPAASGVYLFFYSLYYLFSGLDPADFVSVLLYVAALTLKYVENLALIMFVGMRVTQP